MKSNEKQDEPHSLRFVNQHEIAAIQTLSLGVDKRGGLSEEGVMIGDGMSHTIFTLKSGVKISGILDTATLNGHISRVRNDRRIQWKLDHQH